MHFVFNVVACLGVSACNKTTTDLADFLVLGVIFLTMTPTDYLLNVKTV